MKITDAAPTPWRIVDTGSAFRINDAEGRGLCWIYYARSEAQHFTHMSKEQAKELAVAFARVSRQIEG